MRTTPSLAHPPSLRPQNHQPRQPLEAPSKPPPSTRSQIMLISKEHRVAILTHLFKEGVIVAKKDFNLPKHPEVEEASNLEVIKLMTSLVSRDLVSERFSWKHYYWFLNDAGIECVPPARPGEGSGCGRRGVDATGWELRAGGDPADGAWVG